MIKPPVPRRVLKIVLAVMSLAVFVWSVTASGRDDRRPNGPQQCWDRHFDRFLSGVAGADEDAIYLGADGGWLMALDARTGSDLWSIELGGTIASNILLSRTAVFVASSSGASPGAASVSRLRSISRQTGITSWSVSVPHSESLQLFHSGESVIIVSSSGSVMAVSGKDGVMTWHRAIEGPVSAADFGTGLVAVVNSLNRLIVLEGATGREFSRITLDVRPTSLLMLSGKEIAVGDERGNISVFDMNDRERSWRFKTGARVSALGRSGDGILAVSYDNFLYFLSETGNVIWKRRLAGRSIGDPVLSGSSVVVTDNSSPGALVLGLNDGRLMSQIPPANSNDSDEWPVAAGVNAVALMNSGSMALYTIAGCSKIETGSR